MKAILAIAISTLLFCIPARADFDEVIKYADKGDPKAQQVAGISYHYGVYGSSEESIGIDHEKSVYWLARSSENGNCFASWFLGGLYFEGNGAQKKDELAAKYFLRAAQRGNIKAQRNIAALYLYGTSVPQDYELAYAWASLANFNQREHKNTQALLNAIIPKLIDRDKANQFAVKHMQKYKGSQKDCGNS